MSRSGGGHDASHLRLAVVKVKETGSSYSVGEGPNATVIWPILPWFLRSAWRLFGTFFLVLALLMVMLAFLVSNQLRRSLETQAMQQNALTASLITPIIVEHFDSLTKYVASYAGRPLLRELVHGRDSEGVRSHLSDLLATNPQFDRAFVTDLDGVLWSDYPPAPEVIGKSFSWRNWFKGVSETREIYVSKVYRRSAPPQPYLVAIAVPVRDARDEITGYLVAQHTIEALIDWLAQVAPSTGGSVALIDHEGVLASRNNAADGSPPSLGEHPLVKKALAGQHGTVQTTDPVTGAESLVSYTPVAPVGWVLLTRQPMTAVLAPIAALERTIIGLTLLAFAVMGGLGSFWLKALRGYHRAVSDSETRFRAVSDTANDAVVSADSRGNIVYFNSAAERAFRHTRDEVLGKPLTLLMPERFHATHREGFARFLSTGEARVIGETVELAGRRGDGSEFPLELSLAHWKVGDEAYFTGIMRDVTSSKEAERRIRELNVNLERRANELEAANRELEAFSYSVSHDLRAPLRAIDGFSQALLEDHAGDLDAEGRGYLERVRAAAQRMGHLIDDLLKLSRVTRAEIAREDVDLSALAHEIAESLKNDEPARCVRFNIVPGLKARADPRLMRTALENLIGNAWKFTAGRSEARISVGVAERDGTPVYFVKDNGAGFDMAYAGKLFGAFQRLHDAREFPGTGIGLATVQRIIHKHGGRIRAEAEKGRGATFNFTLEEH